MKPDHSGERMAAVLAMKGLPHAVARVVATIAWHDGPGGAFPTVATIGARAGGMPDTTVRNHTREARRLGVLKVHKGQRGSRYVIDYAWRSDRPNSGRSETGHHGAQTVRTVDARPSGERTINRNNRTKEKAARQEKKAAARAAVKSLAVVSEEATRRQVEHAWSKAADAAGGWDVFSALPSERQEAAVMEWLHKDADRQLALRLFVVMRGGAASDAPADAPSDRPPGDPCSADLGRSLDRHGNVRTRRRAISAPGVT